MKVQLLHTLLIILVLALEGCSGNVGGVITITKRDMHADAALQTDSTTSDFVVLDGHAYDELGNPLNGATVHVEGTRRGGYANVNGAFRITKIPPGTYIVRIKSFGFRDAVAEIEISDSMTIRATLPVAYHVSIPLVSPPPNFDIRPERIGTIRTINSDDLTRTPP